MLSIGNKKYRNLQEQVGFNTEQIEKIFDVLDGLAVTDNVVAIADLSDNLNVDQLEIVQKSVAFLVYDGQLYIKKSEDASNAYFDIVFTISSSGGVVSFTSKEIEVVLATGALSQTTSTNATYSSSQIDSLLSAKADITYVDTQLALKADLTGANFTGAITAPSITENMSGYSFAPQSAVTGFEIINIYCGVVKTGNKLTLVHFFKVKKTSEYSGSDYRTLGIFTIPASVASKIYPNDIGGGDTCVALGPISLFYDNTLSKLDKVYNINKYGSTQLTTLVNGVSSMTVDKYYYGRIEATFLLSDNLAS